MGLIHQFAGYVCVKFNCNARRLDLAGKVLGYTAKLGSPWQKLRQRHLSAQGGASLEKRYRVAAFGCDCCGFHASGAAAYHHNAARYIGWY